MSHVLAADIQGDQTITCPGERAAVALALTGSELSLVLEEALRPHAVTATQYNVLRILEAAPAPGYRRAEIERQLLLPAPDVTRIINRLQAQGLVERQRDTADRRATLHRLSAEGRARYRTIGRSLQAVHDALVEAIGADDLGHLVRICERIVRSIRDGELGDDGRRETGARVR